jgi:FlaA1/EpsC-like NDP-sugar epimerase
MNGKRRKKPILEHWQIIAILLVIYDILVIHLSYFLALFLRFDGIYSAIPDYYLKAYYSFISMYAIGCVIIFWWFHLYQSIWRFASYVELTRLMTASVLTSVLHAILITFLLCRMPLTYYFGGMVLQLFFLASIRFAYRFVNMERKRTRHAEAGIKRVMLIGAGAAGQQILRDINNGKESLADRVVCFIDDNSNKWGR